MKNQLPPSKGCQFISPKNAKRIRQLSWIGRSSIRQIAWCPNGQIFAVVTWLGVWIYDIDHLDAQPILLNEPTEGAEILAFSPDGKLLAVDNGWNGDIILWDLEKKEIITTLVGGDESHFGGNLVFNPDGSILVSKSSKYRGEGDIRLWDVANQTELICFQGNVSSKPFNSDGSLMAFSGGGNLRLWNIRENREEAVLEKVVKFVFGFDNNVFMTLYKEDESYAPEIYAGLAKLGLSGHIFPERKVGAIIPVSKDKLVIYSTYLESPSIWDVKNNTELTSLEDGKRPTQGIGLTLNSDGSLLAYTSKKHLIRIWDIDSNEEYAVLKGHKWGPIDMITFHPQRNLLASASRADETVRIWNADLGEQKVILDGFTSSIHDLDFSPGGEEIVFGQIGDIGQVWNIRPIEQKLTVWERGNGATGGVAFNSAGDKFAVGFSRMVNLYDVHTGKKITSLRVQKKRRSSKDWVKGATVAFSPDGQVLAVNSYKKLISLCHADSGEEFSALEFNGEIDTFSFSPDGEILAVGQWKSIELWNWRTGNQKCVIDERWTKTNLAFSPNGELLAFAGDEFSIIIWNISTHNEYLRLDGYKTPLQSLAFSANGSVLASSSFDQSVKLWNIKNGEELVQLPHRDIYAKYMAFSPDGTLFLTIDGAHIKVWGVPNK